MKIEITKHRLLNGSRQVKPGDILESSSALPETLLRAYVDNGIAKIISNELKQPASKPPEVK